MANRWRMQNLPDARPILVSECVKPVYATIQRGDARGELIDYGIDIMGLWALFMFAPTRTAAIWGSALERCGGALDTGLIWTWLREKRATRVVKISGRILTANGRDDHAICPPGELLHDVKLFESGEKQELPVTISRLLEHDAAGVVATLLPGSPAVDGRWTVQPAYWVAVSKSALRDGDEAGEISVRLQR